MPGDFLPSPQLRRIFPQTETFGVDSFGGVDKSSAVGDSSGVVEIRILRMAEDWDGGSWEMASVLQQLQAELAIKMSEIDDICARYEYQITPTLLLRHADGADSSILIGNDSLSEVVLCIGRLANESNRYELSPHEAVIALIMGEESGQ